MYFVEMVAMNLYLMPENVNTLLPTMTIHATLIARHQPVLMQTNLCKYKILHQLVQYILLLDRVK